MDVKNFVKEYGMWILVFVVLVIWLNIIVSLPPNSSDELSALRLELDLNVAWDDGFQAGITFGREIIAQGILQTVKSGNFVEVWDGNTLIRLVPQVACQSEVDRVVAECNKALEAVE